MGAALGRGEAMLGRGLHCVQRALTGAGVCSGTIAGAAMCTSPGQYGIKSNSGNFLQMKTFGFQFNQ